MVGLVIHYWMPINEKQCTKCGVVKPADRFSPDKRRNDWLQGQCKDCRTEEMRAHRESDPENAREISRRSFAKCRKKGTEYRLAWKRKNPDRVRGYALKRLYGITLDQLKALRAAQNESCAICAKPLTSRAHTDHNHDTGKVRGILCGGCNLGLGFIEKDGYLERALAYLKHHDGLHTAPRSGL